MPVFGLIRCVIVLLFAVVAGAEKAAHAVVVGILRADDQATFGAARQHPADAGAAPRVPSLPRMRLAITG